MASLLPPNSTPLERALESVTERTTSLDVPLRQLADPLTCPAALLPWLAWSLAVDQWEVTWSEEQKRNYLNAALVVHQHRGTRAAVKTAVAALGYELELIEWYQESGRDPGTFGININLSGEQSTNANAELLQTVLLTKNARSHLWGFDLKHDSLGNLNTAAAFSAGIELAIPPKPLPPPACQSCLGAWTTDTIVAPLQPLILSGGPCFHTAETPEDAPAGIYAASAKTTHFQTINWSSDVLRVFMMEPLTTAKIGTRSDVALSLTLNSPDGGAYSTAVITNSTGIRVTSYYQLNERNSVLALPTDKYFVGIRGDGAVIFGTADAAAIMTDSPSGTTMVPLDTAKLWLPAVSIDANREIEGIIKGKVITNASEMSTADFPDLSGYGITEVQDFCGAVVTN